MRCCSSAFHETAPIPIEGLYHSGHSLKLTHTHAHTHIQLVRADGKLCRGHWFSDVRTPASTIRTSINPRTPRHGTATSSTRTLKTVARHGGACYWRSRGGETKTYITLSRHGTGFDGDRDSFNKPPRCASRRVASRRSLVHLKL